jgi:ATP-binding cassette, subfamily B, bacterial PglK
MSASASLLPRAINLLTPRERIAALGIVAISIVAGLVEASILVLVVPIVYAVVDPQGFETTSFGKSTIDRLHSLGFDNPIVLLLGGTFLMLFLSAGIRLTTLYVSEKHAAASRVRLARSTLEKIIAAPFEWSMSRRTAELMTLVVQDIDAWRNDYLQNLLSAVQSTFLILFPALAVIALASTKGLIALVAVGSMVALIVAVFRPKIRRIAAQAIGARDIVVKHLLQTLQGLRDVKLSGNSTVFVDVFARENESSGALYVKARFISAMPGVGIITLGQAGFLAAAAFLWMFDSSPADAAANLALMGILVARVLPAFNALGNQVAQLSKSSVNVERILGTLAELDAQIANSRRPSPVSIPAQWRRLLVCGVGKTFSTNGNAAIKDISFSFERGKVYGIVGKSGAGKSTLANILVGLVEPSTGQVLLDDVPFAQINVRDWHARIGYVPQNSFVLDASIEDNITFGSAYELTRINTVLHQASLADVVAAMSVKSRGNLGERGGNLSGGQIQRLAIARALYREPEVLVFDEATSALDQETEREVQQVLSMRDNSRLTIIIAHRLKTLEACDEILFLDDGKLLGSGTFENLAGTIPAFQTMLDAAVVTSN